MIFRIFKRSSQQNVAEIVSDLVPSKFLPEILEKTADPREIFEAAGPYYHGGVQSLVKKVAQKIKVDSCFEINTDPLNDLIKDLPVERLKHLGTFPILKQKEITALAAIDPRRVRKELNIPENFPIYLSTWTVIFNKWQEAESCSDRESSQSEIVLIDDSSVFCQVLRRYLAGDAYTIKDFVNPVTALEYLDNCINLPELLICDLHMPNLGGSEVLEKLKSKKATKKIPFVALTSDQELDSKLSMISAGADAFIGKHEDPQVIATTVKALLSR